MSEGLSTFDFRRPSAIPDDVSDAVARWHASVCTLTSEAWSNYASTGIRVTNPEPASQLFGNVRSEFPETGLGYEVHLDSNALSSLLVMSRPLVLALLAEMLGQGGEALPEDRELTPVEKSLSELIFLEFCGAVSEAWPEQELISCELGPIVPKPQRTRMYGLDQHVVLCQFDVAGPFGTASCWWCFPSEPLGEFMCEPNETPSENSVRMREALESRAREIMVDVIVHLGEVKLHVAELANLQPGDVLVLDQRISEALTATVAGQRLFQGWPGRIGPHQAFQVQTVV